MRFKGGGALAALAIATAACGALFACIGDDPGVGVTGPRIERFTATPAKLPFGGGKTTLEFSVDGAHTITIEPGIGDVTEESSVDVNVRATTSFVLTARNAGGSVTAEATIAVDAVPIVTGRVQAAGAPVPDITVMVSGKPPVTTNEQGEFTVADVAIPYDVAIVEGQGQATVYMGLRRLDPTLIPLV